MNAAKQPVPREAVWALVYGLVAALVVGTLFAIYEVGARQGDLCESATQNRVALRNVVSGVAALGEDLILAGAEQPSTPEQGAALMRVRNFEERELSRLELPICE